MRAVADIPRTARALFAFPASAVAIFKYDGKISAVSRCLPAPERAVGRRKIVFGCITCPWHGYQYQPDTGASPPPFVEKVPTFNVRVKNGRVFVHPKPNPAGFTKVEPATWWSARWNGPPARRPPPKQMNDEFYIGWEAKAAPGIGKTVRQSVVLVLLLALLVPVLLAVSQRMIGQSVFEWGNHKTFPAFYKPLPVPTCSCLDRATRTVRPASRLTTSSRRGNSIEPGKPSPHSTAKAVSLKGTLIYRGNQTMV